LTSRPLPRLNHAGGKAVMPLVRTLKQEHNSNTKNK
jgi:hypothetical protein